MRGEVAKLDALRQYRSLGQARCLLLGGVSGTGKSSVLNWYASQARPTVQATRNHVPVVKIDAPVSNRTSCWCVQAPRLRSPTVAPERITVMRSPIFSISSIRCVMKITPTP